ncbi:MAG: hypothetical protein QOJ63_1287 [Solirubrobacteraceae bacterium]|nr:hypothetical protein [Solirubrobacteraceae bacterium]
MNRSPLRALLVLGCTACCLTLLAACGDAVDRRDAAAASALEQTLDATSRIADARLTADVRLAPEGLLALGGPITLRANGPFAASAAGALPRFDIAIAASIGGRDQRAGAISTGRECFLRLDGRDYAIDKTFLETLRGSPGAGGAFATLGLDPRAWIRDPRTKGHAPLGGIDTIRIAGGIDVRRLLADLAGLLNGYTAAGGAGGLLTPRLREQIAAAVRSARFDVWIGAKDRILRQLAVVVEFAFDKGSRPPITGLDGGRIDLRLRLDDIDATTVKVVAPRHARPLSELTGAGGLGALLAGLGAGATGGAGGGDGGAAFLACLTAAGAKAADVVRCASKLAS